MHSSIHFLPALIAAAPLLAQAPIPDSPAGQKLRTWLDNYNAGDVARIERYAQENYAPEFLKEIPAAKCARIDAASRASRGEMTLHAVQPKDAHRLEALLTNKDQSLWLKVILGVTPEPPHKVQMLGLVPSQKPAEAKVEVKPRAVSAEAKPAQAVSSMIPDTPVGQKLKAWLEGFNSGDAARVAQFFREHAHPKFVEDNPPEKEGAQLAGAFQQVGALTLHSVDTSVDNTVNALLVNHDRTLWLDLMLKVSSKAPHPLIGIGMRPGKAPAGMELQRLSDEALAKDLDAFLTQRTAQDEFSGVVLIAKDGKPFYQKAFGMADREKKLPNTLDTKFVQGSLTKMLTGTAILQLVQSGKLKLTDTIAQILPDYPNKDVAAKVTVHHLLTHTSGMGDVFSKVYKEHHDCLRTLKDWWVTFMDAPLAFTPGEKHAYSNAGYAVLGSIIEKESGVDYYTYVRTSIFKPLGMADSGFPFKTDAVPNLAIGYTREKPGDPRRPNTKELDPRGFSAGNGVSTAGDLLKFVEGLRNCKLLDKAHTELLTTRKVDLAPGTPAGYAYGFVDATVDGVRTVGHDGGFAGISTSLRIFWNSGTTVMVLSNLDPSAAPFVTDYIRQRIQAK